MNTISVDDIQGDLAGVLRRVRSGETLLVTRAGRPVAEIKPVASAEAAPNAPLRPIGLAEGEFVVPDDFDAPFSLHRQGWDEQFQRMAALGDDRRLDGDALPLTAWEAEEWEW